MEYVPGPRHDAVMELITNIGAVVTGLVTVIVGAFSVASIWIEDRF